MSDVSTMHMAAKPTPRAVPPGNQLNGDSPTPVSIMAAARLRWPEWGPWKVTVTHHEDGRIEYALVGRSSVPSRIENRARIGKDLETLARRVMDSTSES